MVDSNEILRPETASEILLSTWLQLNGVSVWYNRGIAHINNQNLFFVRGSKKKPDLVIYSRMLNCFCAIEVKHSQKSREIYDSSKILDYLSEYKNNKSKYFIDGAEVPVDFFLIATDQSVNGHLFDKNTESPVFPTDDSWHKILQQTKNEPPFEFNKSRQFVRQLWSEWRRAGRARKKEPGVGVLLSSSLDQNKNVFRSEPKIFYQVFQKSRWCVRWHEI